LKAPPVSTVKSLEDNKVVPPKSMDVALATPKTGVTRVGEVFITKVVPVPVCEAIAVALPTEVIGPVRLALVVTVAAFPVIEPTIELVTSRSVNHPLVTLVPVSPNDPVMIVFPLTVRSVAVVVARDVVPVTTVFVDVLFVNTAVLATVAPILVLLIVPPEIVRSSANSESLQSNPSVPPEIAPLSTVPEELIVKSLSRYESVILVPFHVPEITVPSVELAVTTRFVDVLLVKIAVDGVLAPIGVLLILPPEIVRSSSYICIRDYISIPGS
jgi:hypothetical protein